MNRRTFSKTLGTAVFMAVSGIMSIGMVGCTASSVFAEILAWIPVGLNAFSGIVSLVAGASPLGASMVALVGVINAGFAQLKTDIAAYQAITAPPAGALDKIKAGLGVIVSNFETFLQSIAVNDSKLAATVVGLASVMLAAISGFQAALPASTTTAKLVPNSIHINGQTISITPAKYSIRSFTKTYNAIAHKGGHDEVKLPESFFEKVI